VRLFDRKLLKPDGGGKTRGPATDNNDVIFHAFTLSCSAHPYPSHRSMNLVPKDIECNRFAFVQIVRQEVGSLDS
jgi:hypothetical protein